MRIPGFSKRAPRPVGEAAPTEGQLPAPSAEAPGQRRVRRGVTALEYLVCLSLIIVVLIITVQHLGYITGGLFTNSANATTTK